MNFSGKMSRRDVLLAGLAASNLSGFGASLLGGGRPIPPSDKMNIAFVGIGGYGDRAVQELASQNTVALCDVDWRPATPSPFGRRVTAADAAKQYPKAKRFNDWREMLEKMDKEIDGVCVSTADHTHAGAVLTAMKMGKHVLCEKPLAHTVNEVRAMMAAEHKYAHLSTQTGIQGHVSEDRRMISEWIRNGGLGTVKEVQLFQSAFHPRPGSRMQFHLPPPYSQLAHTHDNIPVPPEVKWDLWLGPAPDRPYNPMYLDGRWRIWVNFGTGILGDHGPHFFGPVFAALDLGFPDTIEAETDTGYDSRTKTQLYPVMSRVHYHFPARGNLPALPVTWHGFDTPPIPKGWKSDRPFPDGGGIITGTKGTLVFGRMYMGLPTAKVPGMVALIPDELDREYHRQAAPHPSKSLWMEWVECAKTGKQVSADFLYGGTITQICLLGDIAIRHKGELLRFDPKTEKFTNSDSANQMFEGTSRPGWELPA